MQVDYLCCTFIYMNTHRFDKFVDDDDEDCDNDMYDDVYDGTC